MTTLPPVLYWSASLAEYQNARLGDDAHHGLIDFTGDQIRHWDGDEQRWRYGPDEMPADAVRLVAEPDERSTCKNCQQPIVRTVLRAWRHDREPKLGSIWCDPDHEPSVALDGPHAEPAEAEP